jgi:hypothetical protein
MGKAEVPIDELCARRLTIVDAQGRVRATFGPAGDGSIELRLYDGDDRPRAELAVAASGVTSLTLRDPDGEMRSCLAVGADGDTRLHLHGAAAVSLHDREGQPRALLGLDEQSGMATLSYVDAGGGCCLLLAEDASGGRLHLFQRDGRGRRIPACDPADPEPSAEVTTPPQVDVVRRDRTATPRWLSASLLVILGAVSGTLGGRLVAPRLLAETPALAPQGRQSESIVNAREVVLSDPAGIPRMRLGALPDGTPLIWMTDGKSTIEVGTASGVGAVVRLNGGTSSIELVAPPGEPPSLSASADDEVLFQAPSYVARFLPPDLWP